ncbi:MAG: hypothetical protein LCH84_01855 [Gemmatimonadetes bacterium]|nr:hypothetical protein [Gemmatimonadota bacterium]
MPAYVALCTDSKGDLYAVDFPGTLYHNPRQPSDALAAPGLGAPAGQGWRGVRQLAVVENAGGAPRLVVALDWSDRVLVAVERTGAGAERFVPQVVGTWPGITSLAGGTEGHCFGVTADGHLQRRTWRATGGQVTRALLDRLADHVFDTAARFGAQLAPEARAALSVVGGRLLHIAADGTAELRAVDRTVWRIGASVAKSMVTGLGGHRRLLGAGGDGLYAVSAEGQLLRTTLARTASSLGVTVGALLDKTLTGKTSFGAPTPSPTPTHWQPAGSGLMSWAALPCNVEGYAWPQSAAPGDTVQVHVALTLLRADALADNMQARTFDAALVRLRRMKGGVEADYDEVVWTSSAPYVASVPPALHDSFMQAGCNWPATFSVTIPVGARSGHYAVRLVPRDGSGRFYVPVVVRPAARTAPWLMLANTNTWNTYNQWGGRGKYVHDAPLPWTLPFCRPHPGCTPDVLGPLPTTELMNESHHLLRGELWVAGWLEDQGADFAVDVYSDRDLHRGLVDLRPTGAGGYRGVILNTHPEYWTVAMHDQLRAYLYPPDNAGGGSVIYLGGNGLYEEVVLSDDDQHLRIFPGVDLADDPYTVTNEQARQFCLMRVRGRPEHALIGVGFNNGAGCSVQGVPYLVQGDASSNAALAGLPAAPSGQPLPLGATSANTGFAANGWEVDVRGDASPPEAQAAGARIGLGATPATSGEMLCYRTAAGGVVFAGASLNVGGSLAVDPMLQRVVRNALDMARGTPLV